MQFLKFLIPCLIFSQEVDIVKYGVFEPSVIILIEKKVQEGIITREDADNRYLNFLKTNTNKTKNHESVINNHFKKIGIDDLNKLRNEFLKRADKRQRVFNKKHNINTILPPVKR